MNGTFPDGFPKDPYQAVDFSYFLSDQEKEEWREWIPNANQASQQELVETLHEIWKENQKNAIPEGFENNSMSANQSSQAAAPFAPAAPQAAPAPAPMPAYNPTPVAPQNTAFNDPFAPAASNSNPYADPFDPYATMAPIPSPAPTPMPAYNPAPVAPQPAPVPIPPVPQPAVIPAPTPINVPPMAKPSEDKPSDSKAPGSNHVNEFYFPGQNGTSDSKTTINPPKTQQSASTPKAPEPKPAVTPVSAAKSQPEPKANQSENIAKSTSAKPAPDDNSGNRSDSGRSKTGDSREETVDRQLIKNQLSLLEKLTRSFSRMEKTLEDMRTDQQKGPQIISENPPLGQTAQKIQKDTGALSEMVNNLYDEMSILRTMVQNQQDQIRTLNAHIQKFYTGDTDKSAVSTAPAQAADPIPAQPTQANPFMQNPVQGDMGQPSGAAAYPFAGNNNPFKS